MIWNALICSLLVAAPAGEFKAANQLYDAGKFAEAAAAYEKIEPKTAAVFFNLGNALFRQEKVGLALLNYERARQLAPRDPDVLANLRFAQQRLGVEEVNVPPKAWQRLGQNVVRSRTPNEWARYELAALWLTVLAAAGWVWLPRMRTGFVIVAVAGLCGLAGSAGMLGLRASAPPAAVAIGSKAEARFAPLADATVHFQLPEGAQVGIREDRGEWLLVERADGQQGWVRAAAVQPVGVH